MQKTKMLRLAPVACALALTGMTTSVHAAGFALIDQSASMIGNAVAGGAAAAYDASTIYYNPAGMMHLNKGNQIVAGLTIVQPTADFSDGGSTDWLGNSLSDPPYSLKTTSSGGVTGYVPNFYLATDINDGEAKFGLGINAPFGLSTKYDEDWVGKYHAIESELLTLNINPSVAFNFTEKLAAGFGINIQYVDARLTNDISYNAVAGGGLLAPAIYPDGRVEVKGDGVGFGFNLGLLYQMEQGTKLGISYRSPIEHRVDGTVSYSNGSLPGATPPFPAGTTLFNGGDAKASLTLPEMVSTSFYHDINNKWAVMGDWTWTRWSRFQELTYEFPGDIPGSSTTEEQWKDSSRFALGANYRVNPAWLLRAGVAYDNTPIPSDELRTARIPGNDRTWASIGFNWQASKTVGVDVGYSHLFVDDTSINNTESAPGGATLVGTYEASVDILSAGLVWDF
jgi:long-chain fatty acid transport protein